MAESFVMKKGQVVRHLSSSLMKLKIGERLPSISEFQEEYGVSRGTVQNAIEFLKESGAFEVTSKGRLGSFLTEINYSVLQEYALSEMIIGTMTLPYSKLYEGFATGIYEAFQEANLPLNIAYIRGAKERIKSVVTHTYKFAVLSKFAAEEAKKMGESIEIIAEFEDKTYLSDHVLLLRDSKAQSLKNKMKVGIDFDSIDQYRLTEKLISGVDVQLVEINGSQMINGLRTGLIDAGVWNIDEIKDKGYHDINWVQIPEKYRDSSMSTTVIVGHKEDEVIKAIFNTRINKTLILETQKAVIKRRATPAILGGKYLILEKLSILKDSNIIDEDTHEFVLSVLDEFLQLEIIQEKDEADVFLTHLAMADSRRKAKDYSVETMESSVWAEIKNHSEFNRVKQLWDQITVKYIRENFSENENNYIHLHLLNLLDKEG